MILLDTCVLIWLAGELESLSDKAVEILRDTANTLHVSAISAFEVGQKRASGKMEISAPVEVWFSAMVERYELREISVTGIIAAEATTLPPLHKDPFDRLLIATALRHNLSILTCDRRIIQYPQVTTVW